MDTGGRGATWWHLSLSVLPLLLTVVFPLPFALATGGHSARAAVLAVSRVGVALSFILVAIGVVLAVRASLAGDRRAALLLWLETALAGVPAVIFTVYAAVTRFL